MVSNVKERIGKGVRIIQSRVQTGNGQIMGGQSWNRLNHITQQIFNSLTYASSNHTVYHTGVRQDRDRKGKEP